MDVLKDKQSKKYPYISRYSGFSYYYHILDNKYIYSVTSQLNTNISYVAHKVVQSDTLESLALKYYGRPDYYWVIADFNRIQDPFISLKENFDILRIPSLSNISFE